MDFELIVQARIIELRRVAEDCGRAKAARAATRDNAAPGRFARFGDRLLQAFAVGMPPVTHHTDPWYPWWWDG